MQRMWAALRKADAEIGIKSASDPTKVDGRLIPTVMGVEGEQNTRGNATKAA